MEHIQCIQEKSEDCIFANFSRGGSFQSSLSPPKTAVGTLFCSSCTSVKGQEEKTINTCMFMFKKHVCMNVQTNTNLFPVLLRRLGLLCPSLTFWSLVFIIFILILIINVNLIRVGLFGKLSQLTARGVTPA